MRDKCVDKPLYGEKGNLMAFSDILIQEPDYFLVLVPFKGNTYFTIIYCRSLVSVRKMTLTVTVASLTLTANLHDVDIHVGN